MDNMRVCDKCFEKINGDTFVRATVIETGEVFLFCDINCFQDSDLGSCILEFVDNEIIFE